MTHRKDHGPADGSLGTGNSCFNPVVDNYIIRTSHEINKELRHMGNVLFSWFSALGSVKHFVKYLVQHFMVFHIVDLFHNFDPV